LIKRGYAILIAVIFQIIGFLVGLQICLELPSDWLLHETKIPEFRIIIPFLSMFIGIAVAGIVLNLVKVELTEQERERARKEKETTLPVVGIAIILLGALVLLASSSSAVFEYERANMQVAGIFLLIIGSLIARSLLLLLFSGISIVLVYAGYPQAPAIILAIPFLLSAWLLGAIKKKGGEGAAKQEHYDKRGIYKGYSVRHGDRIEHYDEYGIYIGYSIQRGNKIIRYDKEGKYIGEQEEKRPAGRA